MDNITKLVIGVLSFSGAVAFLTPNSPKADISKNLAVNSSGKILPVRGAISDDDEASAEDTEIVDEDGQTIDEAEDDDESSDDFDVKDFGKPSIGADDKDITSSSRPAEVGTDQENVQSGSDLPLVAASPGSPPPARWEGRAAPAV